MFIRPNFNFTSFLLHVNPRFMLRGIHKTKTALKTTCITIHHALWYSLVHWSVWSDCFLITSKLLQSFSSRQILDRFWLIFFGCESKHDRCVHICLDEPNWGTKRATSQKPIQARCENALNQPGNQTHDFGDAVKPLEHREMGGGKD